MQYKEVQKIMYSTSEQFILIYEEKEKSIMESTESNEIREMGVTDVPCSEEQQDKLDIVKYVQGLEIFITKCLTPMSIAIQGDWGTGKTSTINMLQKRLEVKDKIKCVYFNTWQYSQFSMADDLYISFVNTLVRKCCTQKDKTKEIIEAVQKIGSKLFYNTVKDNSGVDMEELFKKQKEKMESVEKLKDEFAQMIAKEVKDKKNDRIVVFIDDLDRLNPEVAVELLEVIKLFMDVEKCIFVLAIDYEVVVSGVRSKYGQNVSEDKCRSFFDKIIQLPFRLPVESYCLEGLIRETVEDDILEGDIEPLTEFVGNLLGSNPRAFKCLANSFFLIKSVNNALQKGSDQRLDNALIFGSLCIQMCLPKFYQMLVAVEDENTLKELCNISTIEELAAYLTKQKLDLTLDEKEKKNIIRVSISFHDFLTDIQKNHKNIKDMFTQLSSVLQMTAITNVSTRNEQSQKRAAAIKVNKIVINGKEQDVDTPTEAIIEVYREFLGNDETLIRNYRAEEERILTDDAGRTDSFFRNKKELCKLGDKQMYIGVSSSTNDKMKYVNKLCNFIKRQGKEAHVVWTYNTEIIFDSDRA